MLISFHCFSGLWSALFFFGSFIGPTFAGLCVERFGFRWMTFVEWILTSVMFAMDVVVLMLSLRCCPAKTNELQKHSYTELK